MSVPSLIVLYTNDAVEVRYSDRSRLQLSPCGASFLHHDKPKYGDHPLAGLKKIQQRCRYVTSEHRNKVLQALDFRNRFAEHPYLCQDLLIKEDVVPLYSDIREIAWAKKVDKSRSEFLPDGSVRIFSTDEFASLSLSQHHRDFTVCYLSKISQEPTKNKSFVSFRKSASENTSGSQNLSSSSENDSITSRDGSKSVNTSQDKNQSENASFKENTERVSVSGREPRFTRISTPTNFEDDGNLENGGIAFHRYGSESTEASPAGHEISSISKISSEGFGVTLDMDITVGQDLSLEQRSASPLLNDSKGANSSKEMNSVKGDNSNKGDNENNGKHKNSNRSLSKRTSVKDVSRNSSREGERTVNPDESVSSCQCLYTWVTKHISRNECPIQWKHPLNLAEEKSKARDSGENNPPSSDMSEGAPPKLQPVVKINKKQSVMSPLPSPIPLTCPSQQKHKWSPIEEGEAGGQVEVADRFNSGRLKVIMVDGIIYRLVHLPTLKVMEIYPGDGSVFTSQGITGQFYTHTFPAGNKLEERTYSLRTLPPPHPSNKYPLETMLKRACRLLCEAVQRDKLVHKEESPCWKIEPLEVTEPMSVSILEEAYIAHVGRFTAHTNGRVRVVFDDRTSLDMVCDFSKRMELSTHPSSEIGTHKSTATGLDSQLETGTARLLLPSGKYIVINKQKPGSYQRYLEQAAEWASWVNASPVERKQFYERLGQNVTAQGSAAAELQKINCFNYILENTVLKPSQQPAASTLSKNSHDKHRKVTFQINPSSDVSLHSEASYQFRPITEAQNDVTPSPQSSAGDGRPGRISNLHFPKVSMAGDAQFGGSFVAIGNNKYPSNHLYDNGHQTSHPRTGMQDSSGLHHSNQHYQYPGNHYSHLGYHSNHLSGNVYPSNHQQYHNNHIQLMEASSKGRTMEILDGFHSVRQALLQTNKLIHDIDDILDKND